MVLAVELFCLTLLSADGGIDRAEARMLLDKVLSEHRAQTEASKAELIGLARGARDRTTGEDRRILDRMLRIVESDQPLEKNWPEWVQLNRDNLTLARGNWEAERAAVGAFSALPTLALSMKLDPEPLRREATMLARELVRRWPAQGGARGMLASVLLDSGADTATVLPELKRCVQLDPTADWCRTLHTKLIAAAEMPRCSGRQLAGTLTATGAQDWKEGQTGTVIDDNGTKLRLEDRPFLSNEHYAKISADADGNLNIEVAPSAAKRLATETARLVAQSGSVVMRLDNAVVLIARLREPIPDGRLTVTPGALEPFVLEKLCRIVERPSLPAALKL